MIFDAISKNDEGLRFVKAMSDSKRKVLVQLNGVRVVNISDEEITFDLATEKNRGKISSVDDAALSAAIENSAQWFGRELPETIIRGAYTPSAKDDMIECERIDATRVFDDQQKLVDVAALQKDGSCDVIVEFSGIWFAKKNFATTLNVVQVRLHPEPVLDNYPDEFAFVDSDDDDK